MSHKILKYTDLLYKLLIATTVFLIANSYLIKNTNDTFGKFFIPLICIFIFFNFVPSIYHSFNQTKKLKQSGYGYSLLVIFLLSASASVIYEIILIHNKTIGWGKNLVISILVNALVFWNGMIRVYLSSKQLGVKWRTIGAICGLIPIVHLIVLGKMIAVTRSETFFENDKILLNEKRKEEQICKTKYPILMVHGVFFRDFRYFNYWGRIPNELEQNGATIYYGNHQSALSVKESARELNDRIRQIINETGCQKVNIIAHSKGGLDCRYALSEFDLKDCVASLTTINTPHRGCEFADYLLGKIPEKQQTAVANAYNSALKKLGDENPNFIEAVTDLTASACTKRNESVKDIPDIFYQSVGSKLNHASSGRFPLNLSYLLVKYFDGKNDGLVGEQSFEWGEQYQFLEIEGKRGISHGDMIDLNRENIKGFDVREFYVQLVKDLKEKGF